MDRPLFTGSHLKWIALIAMTLDHIGAYLFPHASILRIVGRLAFPIYAYLIAEGCRRSRNPRRYFLRMLLTAFLSQVILYFFRPGLHLCVLFSFSLSILLTMLLAPLRSDRPRAAIAIAFFGLLLTAILVSLRPLGISMDYGLLGILMPAAVYLGNNAEERLGITAGFLAALTLRYGSLQIFAFGALPFLALYSGKRGTIRFPRLFYFYYPAHLAVILLLAQFLS